MKHETGAAVFQPDASEVQCHQRRKHTATFREGRGKQRQEYHHEDMQGTVVIECLILPDFFPLLFRKIAQDVSLMQFMVYVLKKVLAQELFDGVEDAAGARTRQLRTAVRCRVVWVCQR